MSYFIVIHGPLGSGKSTNAATLAITLKAKRVILDDILRDNNLDNATENEGCISADNFIEGLNIVIPKVRKLLENGTIVVFDGCFYHKEVMDHLVQTLSFPHYIFTLKAPLDVCINRDKHREATLGENAARAVHQLVSKHDFGILIDAKKNLQETSEEILSYLPLVSKLSLD